MLGLVVSELRRCIEERHSAEPLAGLLDLAGLQYEGSCTAVGRYPHDEALRLARAALMKEVDESELQFSFGGHFFGRFKLFHPEFSEADAGPYAFLESAQSHLQRAVSKLYVEAQPPSITTERQGEALVLGYRSQRLMALLAQGPIEGLSVNFQSDLRVQQESLDVADGYAARFTLSPAGA